MGEDHGDKSRGEPAGMDAFFARVFVGLLVRCDLLKSDFFV